MCDESPHNAALSILPAGQFPNPKSRFPKARLVRYTLRQMRIAAYHRLSPFGCKPLPRLARVFPALLSGCALALLFVSATPRAEAQAKTSHLLIYTVDVEGGQATLFVA